MDLWVTVAGFVVGVVVGLTGMGGGALMTPVLILFFGIQPLAAVSSDLVASAVMKPVGSLVHLRRGTVNLRLVRWLMLGSVPCAFAGVLVARALGPGARVQSAVRVALGVALLVAAGSLLVKAYLQLAERGRQHGQGAAGRGTEGGPPQVRVRPLPTVVVGAVGGLVVGMTSVGSGSLIIIALLMLYPTLRPAELVGTDLVQAVPLVLSAALGHLLFGDFKLGLTASLLVGSLPGVFLGATLSARAPGGIIRTVLGVVLLASGLKLVHVGNLATIWVLAAVVLVGPPVWMWVRTWHGLPATGRTGRAERAELPPAHSVVDGAHPGGQDPPQFAEEGVDEGQAAGTGWLK